MDDILEKEKLGLMTNGIQHPANWHVWTRQEKEAIGMVEIIEQTPPDSRFYNWSQNPDGTITSTPKELLKTEMK
jgi:hypothetical protein